MRLDQLYVKVARHGESKYEAFARLYGDDNVHLGGVVGYSDNSPWDAYVQLRETLESIGVELDFTEIYVKDSRTGETVDRFST